VGQVGSHRLGDGLPPCPSTPPGWRLPRGRKRLGEEGIQRLPIGLSPSPEGLARVQIAHVGEELVPLAQVDSLELPRFRGR
jgi:hypothetical protein